MKPKPFVAKLAFALAAGLSLALPCTANPDASVPSAAPAAPDAVAVRPDQCLLTSMRLYQSGQNTALSVFSKSDEPVYITTFTWDNPNKSAGTHAVAWNWYRNGILVSATTHTDIEFKRAPHTLKTSRPFTVLGAGSIHVDVVIDGKVQSSAKFEIK
jgi:hypothetical protein